MSKSVSKPVVSWNVIDKIELFTEWDPSVNLIRTYALTTLEAESVWSAINFHFMGIMHVEELYEIGLQADGRVLFEIAIVQ